MDYLGQWHKPVMALRRAWGYHGKAHYYGYDQYQYFNSGVWASSPKARKLIRNNWRKWAFKSGNNQRLSGFHLKRKILSQVIRISSMQLFTHIGFRFPPIDLELEWFFGSND